MECGRTGKLEVQMLGKFAVRYEGRDIHLGRKNTLKFIQLLQLIWISGNRGIRKQELIEALYDGREMADVNNSINNLLYQVKKQLPAAGLPDCEYIIREEDRYLSSSELPVQVDARQFIKLAELGDIEAGEEEKASYYKKALELYKGEFIPESSTELWVIEENMYLKDFFNTCTDWLSRYYRKNGKDRELEELFQKTISLFPYENWQLEYIDFLLSKGAKKDAIHIYQEMVRTYSEDLGLEPTEEMVACYERISQQVHSLPGSIELIKKELLNQRREKKGAYFCDYRTFTEVCTVTKRNMNRVGKSIYLMLCSLYDYEGKEIQNPEKLRLRTLELEEVLSNCLREGDAFTRYNQSQYLIMLVGTNKENCDIVYHRIKNQLKEKTGTKASIKYTVTSLADMPY